VRIVEPSPWCPSGRAGLADHSGTDNRRDEPSEHQAALAVRGMWGAVGTESGRNSRLFRGQLEAEPGSLALEVGQLLLALLRLVALGADVVIGHPVLEHIVDRPRDLVGGGDEGLHGADLGPLATIERAKGRIRAGHGGGGLPEGLPGAIVGLEGARAQHLAAGDVVVGSEAEPGAEMLGGGEAGHIGADLADDGLGQAGADTLHGDQVDVGDAEELLAGGVSGLVLRLGAGFDGRQRGQVIGRVPARGDGGVLLTNGTVAEPWEPVNAYDDRSWIENGLFRNSKQFWTLMRWFPQKDLAGVRTHLTFVMLMLATATAYRLWDKAQSQAATPPSSHLALPAPLPTRNAQAAPEEGDARPQLSHALLEGQGMARWRRELRLQNRDKLIVFVGEQYGIFDTYEFLILTGVPLRKLPPHIASPTDVLRKYGCLPEADTVSNVKERRSVQDTIP